jgi:hypothetical protein
MCIEHICDEVLVQNSVCGMEDVTLSLITAKRSCSNLVLSSFLFVEKRSSKSTGSQEDGKCFDLGLKPWSVTPENHARPDAIEKEKKR